MVESECANVSIFCEYLDMFKVLLKVSDPYHAALHSPAAGIDCSSVTSPCMHDIDASHQRAWDGNAGETQRTTKQDGTVSTAPARPPFVLPMIESDVD